MTRPLVLPAQGISKMIVESAEGSLQIIGAQDPTITIRCADDPFKPDQRGNELWINAEDDLILYVPSTISISVLTVEGDVDARAFSGELSFDLVEGDIQLRNVGNVSIKALEGDLMIKTAKNINVTRCEGDAIFKEISGNINASIDGDISSTNCANNISLECDGDLILNQDLISGSISCQVSGDVIAQIPEDADASVSLKAASLNDLRVNVAGVKNRPDGGTSAFIMGAGTYGISIECEGSLLLTGPNSGGASGWGGIPDLSGLEDSINNFVGETVENALRGIPKVEIDAEKLNAKLHKVEDAMRKVEEKMRSAERRARHTGWRSSPGPVGRAPVEPPPSPVSSEEHMAVLRMLQEKRISIEEAEELLSALEGRS